MSQLIVRDIPPSLFKWLTEEAQREAKTVEELVIEMIDTRAFFGAPHYPARRIAEPYTED